MSSLQPARESSDQGSRTFLPIVIGAHPQAELEHRTLAYELASAIDAKQAALLNGCSPLLQPLVCCDLWYLNDKHLLELPAIAIGDPSLNAATAFLSNRLPTAFVMEGSCRVHLDPEFIDMQVCVWGIDAKATQTAIELFTARYLDDFLNEAVSVRQ